MATDLATLGLEVRSDGVVVASNRLNTLTSSSDRASTATDKFRRESDQLTTTMQKTNSAALTLGKTLGLLGAALSFSIAIKTLTEFEQSMATVRAITRATASEFAALRAQAQALGAATRFTAGEAADAMRYLAQAGFSVNEVLTASGSVLALAQAGNLGLAEASEISAKALRGFRLEAEEMGHVSDVMAKAFNSANTTIQELGDAFTYVAPISATLGVSIEDTTAAIAALSDAGLASTMAGTGLRGIMLRLAAPTKQATDLLRKHGLTLDDVSIKQKGLIPVLETLANADLGEDAFTIFGQRAGPAFEVLKDAVGGADSKMKQLAVTLQNVDGYALETAKIMDDNLYGAMLNFGSSIEDAIIRGSEYTGFTNALKDALLGLADVVRGFTNLMMAGWFDKVTVAILLYVAATKGAVLASSLMGKAFGAQIAILQYYMAQSTLATGVTGLLTVAMQSLRAVLLSLAASPVFWIVAAGTALYTLYSSSKASAQEMEGLREKFKQTGQEAQYISEQAKAAADDLKRLAAEAKLTDAQDAAKAAENVLAGVEKRFAQALGTSNMALSSVQAYVASIATWNERMTGYDQTTIDAANSVRSMYEALKDTQDLAGKTSVIASTMKELRELQKLNPDSASIQNAIKDVQALGGAIKDAIDKGDDLAKINLALGNIADKATGVRGAAEELQKLVDAINSQKAVQPGLDYSEALQGLEEYTKGTASAKQEQFALRKAAAEANLDMLKGALDVAAAELDKAWAFAIAAEGIQSQTTAMNELVAAQQRYNTTAERISTLEQRLSEVRLESSKQENKAAKFAAEYVQKQQELSLRLLQTEAEISGVQSGRVAQLQLEIEKTKELQQIREKAADAGISQNDSRILELEEMVSRTYALKEEQLAYETAWQETLLPLDHAGKLAEALGIESAKASVSLAKMVAELEKTSKQPGLDEGERAARIQEQVAAVYSFAYANRFALLTLQELHNEEDAHTQRMVEQGEAIQALNALSSARQAIEAETINQTIELTAQLRALTEAREAALISQDAYNARMVETNLRLLESKQIAGDATFADNFLIALGTITEGYEGLEQGLTDSFGNFFQSFTKGFADSIGKALVYGQSLKDMIGDLSRQILSQLISSLVQLGIQWAVNAAIGQAISATSQAAATAQAAATGAAMAASYAPAAAMASLASFGANAAPAMAGMTATSVLSDVLAMKGFAEGGYTGDMGRGDIAGVVHGQEYVFDAASTSRIGTSALDALRSGTAFGNSSKSGEGSGGVNITIENYGTPQTYTAEQLTENDVRIIAQDVVYKEAPKVVADDMNAGNSVTSKSYQRNFKTERRHT